MSQVLSIHPDNPHGRKIKQAVDAIESGEVIAVPTDSAYALVGLAGAKQPLEKMRQIRRLGPKHNFTLMCRDLAHLSTYAIVDNMVFRMLKSHTPGAYTFILSGSREVPRRVLHPKKRTIGLRVPDHAILQAILSELSAPLLSTSLILPDESLPMADAWEIKDTLGHCLPLVIEGGFSGYELTTVVDLTTDSPDILRIGLGDPTPFEY